MYIVSATKAIMQTNLAEKVIIIIPRGQLERLQQSPLHNRNNVELYVTSANCQKAGLSNNTKYHLI